MISDPVGDMLTRIRNGLMIGKASVDVPKSKLKLEIARILKAEGYIEDYQVVDEAPPVSNIRITLKYYGQRRERKPVITNIERVSKPGRRIYSARTDMPRVMSGMGIAIVTTPRGVMTAQEARRQGVGGEILCYVW
jgi:small subunit ribosomal protein S8